MKKPLIENRNLQTVDLILPKDLKETLDLRKRLNKEIEELKALLSSSEFSKYNHFQAVNESTRFKNLMNFSQALQHHQAKQEGEYQSKLANEQYVKDKLKEIKNGSDNK